MIRLENISKKYKNFEVLKDINLSITNDDMIAIVGESGNGKTTLLNILGLIDLPTKGKYYFDGVAINKEKEMRERRSKDIGFVLQHYGLIGSMTVKENLELALRYAKIPKKEWVKEIDDVLNLLKIEDLKNNKAYNLSGGQKQRVAIARAIVKKPKIILADEPTGNLDNKNTDIVLKLLLELNQQGLAVVIVTHDLNIAKKCKKLYELTEGKLISQTM